MTDEQLARETCGLLGWRFDRLHPGEHIGVWTAHGYSNLSWPDLSQAALEEAGSRGWLNGNMRWTPEGAIVVLHHPVHDHVEGEAEGEPSRATCRAICAACIATKGADHAD